MRSRNSVRAGGCRMKRRDSAWAGGCRMKRGDSVRVGSGRIKSGVSVWIESGGPAAGKSPGEGAKYAVFLAVCLFGTVIFGGCSLAREELATGGEDRLAGVFITEEYLDTGEPKLTVNRKGEVSLSEEAGRIWGELIWEEEKGRYDRAPRIIFEGTEGYGIYDVSLWNEQYQSYTGYNWCDDIFGEMNIKQSDEGVSVKTTVLVEPAAGRRSLYCNPVYQTPQGQFYVQAGQGLSAEMTAGASMSTGLSWERTKRENGEESGERVEFTIEIVCSGTDRPQRLLLMGEDGSVQGTVEQEQLEQFLAKEDTELRIPEGTAYLIVEREGTGQAVSRSLCAEGEAFIRFWKSRGDGYLEGGYLSLVWE
ncbi:MAG: hypothetical protein NC541_06055 [bacterium]|nr:hypothetical protein [bacterium]